MAMLEIGGTEAKKVWLQSSFYPVKNRKGDLVNIVNIEQDMTESKRAEEDLKQTRSYIEQLMKTANVIIVNLDEKGRVLHLNPAGERITGYAFSELQGKSWFETLVPRDEYPYVHEEFMRLMKGGLPKLFENPILTKSGEERFISWINSEIKRNEKVVGVISFGIDVTANKHALEALRESEQKFRDLVEQSPAVFELYNKDGTLVQVNPAFERLWNLSRDDVVGKFNVFKSEQVKKSGFIPYFEKAFSGEAATPPDIEFDASL